MNYLYAIPGLGNTSELYRHISVPGYVLKVLEWPEPAQAQDMQSYALAFLPQIDRSRPVSLLGVSFGGMLCAELAEQLKTNKVFLVSTSKNRTEFPLSLKLLKVFPLHRLFSDRMIRSLAKNKRRFLGFEKSFEPVFFHMIDKMPKNYFTHCIRFIIGWARTTNSAALVQMHGTADRLLLYKKAENSYTIKGGSHAMILSRAAEINSILNQELNGTAGAA